MLLEQRENVLMHKTKFGSISQPSIPPPPPPKQACPTPLINAFEQNPYNIFLPP